MSTMTELQSGIRYQAQFTVQPKHTVPAVDPDWPGFTDMPPVLATAMMIGFMEQTCVEALRPYLTVNEHTVGTGVQVRHVAATLAGDTVTATVTLDNVEGRFLLFHVSCHDDHGLIGEGTHQRAMIDPVRFMQRLMAR
ncbi:thioesterase family protein [Kluyvera ascorbata]